MFELTISNNDGSFHWREHFNARSDADLWLAEQMTRPDWDHSKIIVIVDKTPPPPTQAEKDAEIARRAQMATLRQRLSELDGQADLTAAEVKEALRKLVKYLRTSGILG